MDNNVSVINEFNNEEETKMTYEFAIKGYCKNGEGCYEIRSSQLRDPIVSDTVKDTTHNRMELNAAIVSLYRTPEGSNVKIMSTSQYLVEGLNQNHEKNLDLWTELEHLVNTRNVSFVYVKDIIAEAISVKNKEAVEMGNTIIVKNNVNHEEENIMFNISDTAVNKNIYTNNEEEYTMTSTSENIIAKTNVNNEEESTMTIESETTNVKAVKLYYDGKIGEAKLIHKKSKDVLGDIRIEGKTKIDKFNAAKEVATDKAEKKNIAKNLRVFRAELAIKKDKQQIVVTQNKLVLDQWKLAKIKAVIAAESGTPVKIKVEVPVDSESVTASKETPIVSEESINQPEEAIQPVNAPIEHSEEIEDVVDSSQNVTASETVASSDNCMVITDIHSDEAVNEVIENVNNPEKDVVSIKATLADLTVVFTVIKKIFDYSQVKNFKVTWDEYSNDFVVLSKLFTLQNVFIENVVEEAPAASNVNDVADGSDNSDLDDFVDYSDYNPKGVAVKF